MHWFSTPQQPSGTDARRSTPDARRPILTPTPFPAFLISRFSTPTYPHTPTLPPPSRRAAFTLVEVALAAMVIGLGILTLFGLARIAAQAAAEAEDETRAALFAETVFATLTHYNNLLNQPESEGGWNLFWQGLKDGGDSLPDAFAEKWQALDYGVEDYHPDLIADGHTYTNHYFSVSQRGSNIENIPEGRIVYRIKIDLEPTVPSLAPEKSLAMVNVSVWPTRSVRIRHDLERGTSEPMREPYTFFRIFLNHGPLPHAPDTP